MKKILSLIFLFVAFTATAQKKVEYDSMIVKTVDGVQVELGTVSEYREQQGWSNRTNNKYLCRLIGFKEYWITYLIAYMDDELRLGLSKSTTDKSGNSVLVFAPEASLGVTKKVYVKYRTNNNDRITYLSITGDLNNLIKLFVWYWPSTVNVYSESNLKRGKIFFKFMYVEKISFDWRGTYPVIKLTKKQVAM